MVANKGPDQRPAQFQQAHSNWNSLISERSQTKASTVPLGKVQFRKRVGPKAKRLLSDVFKGGGAGLKTYPN